MKRVLLLLFFLAAATGYSQYCTTGLYSTGCTSGDDLDGFSLGSFSHTGTGCGGTSGYNDFTSMIIPVIQTIPQPLTVTTNYGSASEHLKIFIDYNNDGDFDDPGEEIYASSAAFSSASPIMDSITFPAGSPTGTFRLRARVVWGSSGPSMTGCSSHSWGETHDYTIQIDPDIEGGCADYFSDFDIDSISGTAAKVDWTPGAGNGSYYFEYGPVGFTPGSAAGTKHTGTYPGSEPPLILTGLSPQTTYDYYFGEICNSGADSAYYPIVKQFTTTKLCASPTGFTTSNVTPYAVDLSWGQAGTFQEFYFIWGPSGFDPSSGTGNQDTATSWPHTLTGLPPASTQDIYMVTYCGAADGFSDTVGPVSVTTLCAPVNSYPYLENFDALGVTSQSSIFPNCWNDTTMGSSSLEWQTDAGSTNSTGTGPNADHTTGTSTGAYAYLETSSGSTGDTAYLQGPTFDVTSLSVPSISFWYHMYGGDMGELALEVSSDDGLTWTTVYSLSGEQQNSDTALWRQVFVDISQFSSANFTFRFRGIRGGGFESDMAVDDVMLGEAPPCPPPGANILSATDTSVALNIVGGGSTYEVEWGSVGYTPGTGCMVTVGSGSVTVDNSMTSGCSAPLVASTTYHFYVRNNCTATGDSLSDWVGPFTVTTACAMVSSYPYLDDFDTATGNVPDCWNMIAPSATYWDVDAGGTPSSSTGPAVDHTLGTSSGQYVFLEASSGSMGDFAILESPLFDISSLTTPELSFWYHMYGDDMGELRVEVSDDSGASWTTIFKVEGQQQTSSTDAWKEANIDIGQFQGGALIFRFVGSKGGSDFHGDMAIDDVAIGNGPACAQPGMFLTSATDSSATFNIIGSGSTYTVEYGPTGFTPGTGCTAGVGNGSFTVNDALDPGCSFTIDPNTAYDIYVWRDCSGSANGLSDTVGPVAFRTAIEGPQGITCPGNNASIVLEEEFNTQGGWTGDIGTFTGQWQYNSGATGSSGTGPSGAHSGSNYIYFEANGAGPASLVSPSINLVPAINEAELSFWLHAFGPHVGYLAVKVSTAGVNGPFNDTIFLYDGGSLQNSEADPWQQVGARLDNYIGQTIWLEFEADQNGTLGDIALDLVTVEACGDYCLPEIYNLDSIVVNSAYDATVYIDSTSDNFQLEWGPCGYSQGTGTFMTGSSPFNLSNLTPSTCYDVYVRRNCGAGNGFSGWGGPFTFSSPCISYCNYDVDLYDSWGDGWNGAEISFYQNDNIVATVGGDFTTGNEVLNLAVQLCDSVPTYVVLTDAGNYPGEIGFDVTSPYPNLLASHSPASASAGDTLAVFNSSCALPSCVWPNNLGANTLSADSAELFWTPPATTANSYEVSYGIGITSPQSGTIVSANDSTIILGGLSAASGYCYFVRSICSATDTSLWNGPYCFSTPCGTGSCAYDADLYDTYGDGWNGAEISFIQNGNVMATIGSAFTTGSSLPNIPVNLCDSIPTYVVLTSAGSYSNEIGFDINTPYNTMAVSHSAVSGISQGDTLATFFTECIAPTCPMPSAASISNITFNSADVSWTSGGANDWQIEYGPSGFTLGTGNLVNVSSTNYPLTGLNSTTAYDVYIRDSCSATDKSNWLGPISFTTSATCFPPDSLAAKNVTMTSADISWATGGAAQWQVLYGTAGFTPGSGSGTMVSVSNIPKSLAGLSAGTMYDVYVRDSCGIGDVSIWSGPLTFSTLCNLSPISLPHIEGFEDFNQTFFESGLVCDSTDVNIEFTSNDPTGRLRFTADPSFIHSGNSAATLDKDPSGSDVINYLILTYDMSNYAGTGNGVSLDFYYMHHGEENQANDSVWIRGSSSDSWIGIYDLYANQGTAGSYSFVELLPVGAILASNGQSFSSSFGIRFGQEDNFPATSTTASDGYTFDDITLYNVTCPNPWGLTASNVQATSATLTWTAGTANNADFEISYGLGISHPDSGTTMLVNDSSAVLTNLTAVSSYCYFVREICGAGDTSVWAGPYCFNTPCVTVPAPYAQDFENFTVGHFDGSESCWDFVSNNAGTTPSGGFSWEVRNTPQTTSGNTGPAGDNTMYPATGGAWIHSDNSGASSNDSTMFTSPPVDISMLSTPRLEYHFHNHAITTSNYRQPLYVDIYDGNTWHNKVHDIDTIFQSSATDPWQDTLIDLTPYNATGVVQVRFRSKITRSAGGSGDVAIDDVSIYNDNTGVSCIAPTGLTAANITTTGGHLEWRPGTFRNADFEVSLGANISTPGAGTSVIVTDSSHAATGLSSSTNYCYFVREICVPGDTSAWTGPYCFTTGSTGTPCQPVTNVAAGNVECDNLEVTWTSNTNSSIIEYGPTGFTKGQGTPTVTVTSPHTLTGLAPGTDYDVYIADLCSGDTSAFSAPLTVTTDTVPKPVAAITAGTDSVTLAAFYIDLDASGSTSATSYSWDFGNGDTATGAGVQGVYTANGTYTVILTAANACGTDTAMYTVNAQGISLTEDGLGSSLSVYPNPTQGEVTIEFDAQMGSDAMLRVMDLRGREVKRLNYSNVNGLFRESISLEGMAEGIYMIEITSGDMRAYRRITLQ